jgi:predicted TIM-barrel fold metal-dependent hydrolase
MTVPTLPAIDLHSHVFPDRLDPVLSLLPPEWNAPSLWRELREQVRGWTGPLVRGIHRAQPTVRHFPKSVRLSIDELTGTFTLPSLLVESTLPDLLQRMEEAGIQKAVVVAQAPFASNEFVLEAAEESDGRLIPAVNFGPSEDRPALAFGKAVTRGARFLKIHPAADGENADSPRYLALLRKAADLGVPVILHTGCLQSHLIYRSPELGDPRHFEAWFRRFPHVTFVLAHLGFHDPKGALELAARYENLLLETSWQPAEIIGEAVRLVGAERVVFGTDWPFIGDNFRIGLERLERAGESDGLSREQLEQIAFRNALRLLGEIESRLKEPELAAT